MNGDVMNKAQYDALQSAFRMLESRYTDAMRSKADLCETVDLLEHTVQQLQGETDTIGQSPSFPLLLPPCVSLLACVDGGCRFAGEYVQLYHMQRLALLRKQKEKDDYVNQLARERHNMSEKLARLQTILMKLIIKPDVLKEYSDCVNPNDANDVTLTPQSSNGGADGKLTVHSTNYVVRVFVRLVLCFAGACESSPEEVKQVNGASSANTSQPISVQLDPKLVQTLSLSENLPVQDLLNLCSDIQSNFGYNASPQQDESYPHCSCCSGRVVHV